MSADQGVGRRGRAHGVAAGFLVPPRVLVAQIGARRHYAVARALAEHGVLEQVVTDACADVWPWSALERVWPARWQPAGLRRVLDRRLRVSGRQPPRGEFWFALSGGFDRRGAGSDTERWAARNARFCRAVCATGFGAADTVYAYNAAALEIFESARAQGLRTVLDQTAAPWDWNRTMLERERERWPDWEDQPAEVDARGVLGERERAEWALADRIICGSEFARDAVLECGGDATRCRVVHYPEVWQPPEPLASRTPPSGRRLRLLFVGTLQLRKGLPYLLEAMARLDPTAVELRLVGPSRLSAGALARLAAVADWRGSVPRTAVASHYAWADVLVLPTLSEGSANVVHEAMAAGLAVVTTPAAGSLIRDGEDGLLVAVRDSAALARACQRLLVDPLLVAALGRAARARMTLQTMVSYADRLLACLPHQDRG